jgi:hypothetical protein
MFALLSVDIESGGDVKWRVKVVRKNGGGVSGLATALGSYQLPERDRQH